jgi:hypothetical protein
MEDGSSIRKTTEEKREEDEVARAVNATLAEEEKKRKEEEDEKKKQLDLEKKKKEGEVKIKKDGELEKERKGKGEALPCYNLTCPIIKPCQPCEECPGVKPCSDCPPEKECPEVRCGPCPPIFCQPCPVSNMTNSDQGHTTPSACPGEPAMSVPAAIAVGAMGSLLITGVAAAIGLVLRYVPPIASGFFFLATIIIVWYLCSQYPETAREIGGRAANLLREAAVALGHRVMEAIRRHQDQVGFPILLIEFHV